MIVKKVVITAAGLGTRLLPMSKELPKEMLPIYTKGGSGTPVLKPLLQALFEQLYRFGIREFCFIVGRGKRAVEDHFTPDPDYVAKLNNKGKNTIAAEMVSFYRMVEDSTIVWINQPEPKGFGHAVLMAKPFVEDDPFLVCAGDTYIISKNNEFLKRLVETHERTNSHATILLQRVRDPRKYGVAEVKSVSGMDGVVKVSRVVEKPEKPPSNLAIMPFYIFKPEIMDVLERLKPGVGGEIQLTDGIQGLIDKGRPVYGVLLREDEIRLDIGTPETYWEAIRLSHEYFSKLK